MNDLVSRQAVLDMAIYTPVAPILVGGPILIGGDFVWRHVIFKENVENLPAVKPETESIIRCKDCRFWKRTTDSLQGICYLLRINPTGMWYCANARPINDGYQKNGKGNDRGFEGRLKRLSKPEYSERTRKK